MSRGPGRWQREILAALDQVEAFYLVDLLPDGYTRAQYNGAHRAAVRLDDTGRIALKHFIYGTPKLVVGHAGTDPKRPDSGGMDGNYHERAWCWCGLGLGVHEHAVSVEPVADLPALQHLQMKHGAAQ